MKSHKPRTTSINDFREWNDRGELILAPKFQRRKVWVPKAKSYLIDTILRGIPIPSLYLRQQIDVRTKTTKREVVDGQQRIAAILDYIKDDFAVLKIHNKKYGGMKFSELPDDVKERFLEYDLSIDFLIGANDSDVLDVFSRINSYTVTLNAQEKINAEFSGKFKQTVFKLGRDHLEFWRKNKILTEMSIARMKEAELSADMVIAIIDGIQDRKRIKLYYEKYEDKFSREEQVVDRFKKCIDTIAQIFGGDLSKSAFRSVTLFYSLFCVCYDILFGLPNSKVPRTKIRKEMLVSIRKALSGLEEKLAAKKPPSKYFNFIEASTKHTTDQSARLIRHRVILGEILKELNIN